MTTYRVTFDRIGRNRLVAPLEASASDADELAAAIARYARPRLVSRGVEVVVDLDEETGKGEGSIYAGVQSAGNFDVERL